MLHTGGYTRPEIASSSTDRGRFDLLKITNPRTWMQCDPQTKANNLVAIDCALSLKERTNLLVATHRNFCFNFVTGPKIQPHFGDCVLLEFSCSTCSFVSKCLFGPIEFCEWPVKFV